VQPGNTRREYDVRIQPHTAWTAPVRLVASDLDGTLLRTDGSISARTHALLSSLPQHNIALVLVSARPPRSLRRISSAIGVEGVAIGCNGALIYDARTETILDHWPISSEVATRLVTDLRQRLPDACFAIENGLHYGCERGYQAILGRQPEDECLIDDALALVHVPVTKLLMRHPLLDADTMLAVGRSVAGNDAVATHSGTRMLEFSAAGVDKASALAVLSARLGVIPEHVVAFGDMPNDVAMLRWAGQGVAVANAHHAVLSAADMVTASNDEDGVAVALEALLGLHNGNSA
jgi:HAD superfamily hydrolase (TIGR01484 family)